VLKKFKKFKETLIKESKSRLVIKNFLTSRIKLLNKFYLRIGFKKWKESITVITNENNNSQNAIENINNYYINNDNNEYSFEEFEAYDDDDETDIKINSKMNNNKTNNSIKIDNDELANFVSSSKVSNSWREKVINSRKALQNKVEKQTNK